MRKDQLGAQMVANEIAEEVAQGRGVGPRMLERWSRLLAGEIRSMPDPNQLSIPIPPPVKARARTLDRSTSHEAARSAVNLTGKRRSVLRACLRLGRPATDQELHQSVWIYSCVASPSGTRTRRSECERAGWVKAAGSVKVNGRRHTLWAITPAGVDTLAGG